MAINTGNLSASILARFARANLFGIQRAAFRIRYHDDETVALALFGNDNYSADSRIRREVAQIRLRLRDVAIEELGFGLSRDGHTWALLLKVNNEGFHTKPGKAFPVEMAKAFLDDIIHGGWRAAGELCPDSAVWLLKSPQPTA
jgi:hypothetical protein